MRAHPAVGLDFTRGIGANERDGPLADPDGVSSIDEYTRGWNPLDPEAQRVVLRLVQECQRMVRLMKTELTTSFSRGSPTFIAPDVPPTSLP